MKKMKKMKKRAMWATGWLAFSLAMGACAGAEELVSTGDGFRRAAQGANGTVLLLEQETEIQDGIAVRVDAKASLLDAENERVWQTAVGGDGEDALYQAVALPQGGWLAAGLSGSTDLRNGWHEGWYSDVSAKTDGWVVRLSALGDVLWTRCYGGTDWDSFAGLCPAADGGWVLAGATHSSDGDVQGWHDSGELNVQPDGWLVCVDADGDMLWQRTLGGSGSDALRAICALEDGYLAVGNTSSTDGDAQGVHADATDAWAMRLDARGEIIWSRCWGEDGTISGFDTLVEGWNGHFLAAGTRGEQGLLVCLDAQGNTLWERALDGHGALALDALVWRDGVWMLAGRTLSMQGEESWALAIAPQGDWKVVAGAL